LEKQAITSLKKNPFKRMDQVVSYSYLVEMLHAANDEIECLRIEHDRDVQNFIKEHVKDYSPESMERLRKFKKDRAETRDVSIAKQQKIVEEVTAQMNRADRAGQ
jgi:hypothetical protein